VNLCYNRIHRGKIMQKILIVEDDEKLCAELEIFLNNNGYEVESLKNFEDTFSSILNTKTNLVLLDINLPNANGEYILKEVRKVSDVPIIIVTSSDNELDELISINYGADYYITKPYNIQILLAKIEAVLRRAKRRSKASRKT
jgi:DNA-binding response OmpR family regulator